MSSRTVSASVVRAAALTLLLLLGVSRDASAQASGFLTRVDYSLLFSTIASQDPRFSSQASIVLATDLVDYGAGRITLGVDYEAFIGSERRRWDLNQGTYRFDLAASRRLGNTELSATFIHVSRHLVDRESPPSIAWNVVGVRAQHRWTIARGTTTVDGRVDAGHAMQQAVVDYSWGGNLGLSLRHRPTAWRRVSFLADASGTLLHTKRELYGRSGICGSRFEGGLRAEGERAALEAFVAYERRFDAFPGERFRVRMWTFGFRIASK